MFWKTPMWLTELLFCHDAGRIKQNQNHEAACNYSIHFLQNLKIQLFKKIPKDTQGWERLGETRVEAQQVPWDINRDFWRLIEVIHAFLLNRDNTNPKALETNLSLAMGDSTTPEEWLLVVVVYKIQGTDINYTTYKHKFATATVNIYLRGFKQKKHSKYHFLST